MERGIRRERVAAGDRGTHRLCGARGCELCLGAGRWVAINEQLERLVAFADSCSF